MDNKSRESDPWEMLKENQEFSYWKEVKIGTEVKRIFARNPLELNYLEKAILKGENPLRLYEIYKIYLDRKEEFPFVNDYLGGKLAIEHLYENNWKNPAFVGHYELSGDIVERYEGVKTACENLNIDCKLFTTYNFSMEESYNITKKK